MRADEVVTRLGGLATRAQVLAETTEHALRCALVEGAVVRVGRGRYALPEQHPVSDGDGAERRRRAAEAGRRGAHELTGVVVLASAAAAWDWPSKWYPTRPQVAVRPGRSLSAAARRRADIRRVLIPTTDLVDGWVTDRTRTAVDCALHMPPDEALSLLDSALREGVVTQDELLLALASRGARHPGSRRAEALIRLADPAAANPFESVLRWIVHDVPGLSVAPQVPISDDAGFVGVVDLADDELRIVLEADSYEFHGDKEAFALDCVRYDRLVADDWLVLRFTWAQVMYRPEWVRDVVLRTTRLRQAQRAAGLLSR